MRGGVKCRGGECIVSRVLLSIVAGSAAVVVPPPSRSDVEDVLVLVFVLVPDRWCDFFPARNLGPRLSRGRLVVHSNE